MPDSRSDLPLLLSEARRVALCMPKCHQMRNELTALEFIVKLHAAGFDVSVADAEACLSRMKIAVESGVYPEHLLRAANPRSATLGGSSRTPEPRESEQRQGNRGGGAASRLVLLLALLFFAGCSAYGPPRAHETIHRNVRFASPQGHNLHMDLYVPKTAQPAPVVIWIFGGSWKIGSKGYHVNLRNLTRSGIAVAAIQYRFSSVAPYPAQLQDCQSALDWLHAHGPDYHLDPKNIGISGESAGGHLAALLGTTAGTPSVRAVCALYPPTDLVRLGRKYANPDQPSDIERLLGGPIEKKLALAAAGSPVNHVNASSPPFLIIHGDRDELVPLDQSQELHARLRKAHIESRLVVVPGKGHWFLLDDAQVEQVAQFFLAHFSGTPADSKH